MELFDRYAKLLFESALLKRIQRTGYAYLGTGGENVASHSFGVIFCAWILSEICEKNLDKEKIFKMALIHDLAETRIGDFNAVNKIYNKADERKALEDAFSQTPIKEEVLFLWEEYRNLKNLEAKLVHDADIIDLIIQLKEQKDLNNPYADKWIEYAKKRLITNEAKKLVEAILKTEWCSWWLEYFVKNNENTKYRRNS
ncbi:MAG: 5'-deoxynucleotidase YfbR and related HD superfamily hydrolases [Thermodesulfobacteria bacterium]|nr:HD domain-containing protein [Thermodesulfobacteriota bacterium]MCU4138700.1 5'-deoxynucleotidase YfbR and related HD superfamily hydrolases [Thermodesulfobacteriota bacterium]